MNTEEYAQEFDENVEKYNQWLDSLKKSKPRKNKAILKGAAMVLDISGTPKSRINSRRFTHPIYSRKDLTSKQKQAIALASDLKRTSNALEKVIENSEIKNPFQDITQGLYNIHKNIYISEATK